MRPTPSQRAPGGSIGRSEGGLEGHRRARPWRKALAARIRDREARVGVVGLGYVGLPLLVSAVPGGVPGGGDGPGSRAGRGDRRGRSYLSDLSDEVLREAARSLRASTRYEALRDCDVVVVCVPTPIKDHDPDLGHIRAAGEGIARELRPGMLVILESTTYPGTTEEVLRPILETSGLAAGRDFALAYSPERIDPGRGLDHLAKTPKVVGAPGPGSSSSTPSPSSRPSSRGPGTGESRRPYVAQAARLGIGVRRWLLRRADLVLAVSGEMRRRLIAQGVAPDRVMAFPLGSELPRAPSKRQVERLREELGLSDAPVVLYFGTIDRKRRLDFVVRVAARVRGLQPEARWVLMGPASDGEGDRLRRYAEELGLGQQFLVLGPVPRSEVPRYLGLASVTVSPIPTTVLYVASSPTKAVESLALGVPVVGTPIPDQAELIAASGGGSIAPFEEEPFAAAVAGLLADPPAARRMGARGRRHVRSHRSYERLAGSVEARYLALVPPGTPGNPPRRG